MKAGTAHLQMAREAVDAQKSEHDDGGSGQIKAVADTLDVDTAALIEIALAHGDEMLATVDPDATPDDVAQAFAACWLDGVAVGNAHRRSVEA